MITTNCIFLMNWKPKREPILTCKFTSWPNISIEPTDTKLWNKLNVLPLSCKTWVNLRKSLLEKQWVPYLSLSLLATVLYFVSMFLLLYFQPPGLNFDPESLHLPGAQGIPGAEQCSIMWSQWGQINTCLIIIPLGAKHQIWSWTQVIVLPF